jgi:hypothetical protein
MILLILKIIVVIGVCILPWILADGLRVLFREQLIKYNTAHIFDAVVGFLIMFSYAVIALYYPWEF